jgi:hypothetical protein
MRTALLCSDYYGSSAPPRRHRPATSLPAQPTEVDRDGADGVVPTFMRGSFDRRGAQLCPCSIATVTPQTFTVASTTGEPYRSSSSSHLTVGLRAANQPRSVRFELANVLRSVRTLVHSRYTVLSCLPDPRPSDGADPSRRCQGCSHLRRRSPLRAALSFSRGATTPQRPCPFTTARSTHASWRTGSHVHHATGRRGRHPAVAPAASPRLRRRPSPWPPHRRLAPASESTPRSPLEVVHCKTGPYPPDLSRHAAYEALALVPRVHLLVSLAEPAPSGSTGTSRRCQGCFPPSPASPGSGCPQLHPAAATARRWSPSTSTRSHSASWRAKSSA